MRRTNWVLNVLGVVFVTLFVVFPLYWSFRTAVSPSGFRGFWPREFTLDNFDFLFERNGFMRNVKNSLIVSFWSTVLVIPLSVTAGYALARFEFPGKRFTLLVFLLPLVPSIAVLVPLILFMRTLNLLNTLTAVVIGNTVFTLPFAIWMFRGFFMQIPRELDDAARLDGASRLQALYRVVLPLSAPGLIAVGIFALINSWNNYLYSFAFTSTAEVQVVPARLLGFIEAFGTNYGGMNAAGLVAMLPPLVFFLIFQKWFVQGMLQGSVK